MSQQLRSYQFGSVALFVLIHLSVVAAFFVRFSPWLLVWTAATYAIRMFAVTAGYHRYFSHRSYKLGRRAQFVMAALAQSSGQKGVLWWAAHHRQHHRHSDEEADVHSPWQRNFWWAHVGWVVSNEYDAFDSSALPRDVLYQFFGSRLREPSLRHARPEPQQLAAGFAHLR